MKTEEIIAEDSNRARIVAIAVASAVREASQQDWEAACRSILENKSLTESEKNCITDGSWYHSSLDRDSSYQQCQVI
ncbi:7450_t:CDS:2 [Funneliformis geosporum]|nr:7450_t:CDS:2 [Funneliformis geosporum]